jgi:benzoate membrane transport protein
MFMFDSNSLAHRLPVIEGANALVAFLFAASAPVAIILSAGIRGGLTEADLASWIFAAFAVNGILTVLMSAVFRQPLAFFWTIPGTVLVGAALQTLGFAEVIGAYLLTGRPVAGAGADGLGQTDHGPAADADCDGYGGRGLCAVRS